MDSCIDEALSVVQELPDRAREIWTQAFGEALLQVNGDMRRAAAMAWNAFKVKEKITRTVLDREKAEKAIVLVAVRGGTPEWIRLINSGEVALADGRYTCLVDRRAFKAILSSWQRRDTELVVKLENRKMSDKITPVVGWIKELEGRSDGLWIRVEWTEAGLGHITRKEFSYLTLVFILDESHRLVELWHARLTNYPSVKQWEELTRDLGEAKESKPKGDRKLTLVKGVNRLEVKNAVSSPVDLKQDTEMGGAKRPVPVYEEKELAWSDKYLMEIKGLLDLKGEVSWEEVKEAITALKIQRETYCRLKDELEMLKGQLKREVIGKAVEEAVQTGKIKPEQRVWAETYALQDWQGFKEFLELSAKALSLKKKMKFRIVPFSR